MRSPEIPEDPQKGVRKRKTKKRHFWGGPPFSPELQNPRNPHLEPSGAMKSSFGTSPKLSYLYMEIPQASKSSFIWTPPQFQTLDLKVFRSFE